MHSRSALLRFDYISKNLCEIYARLTSVFLLKPIDVYLDKPFQKEKISPDVFDDIVDHKRKRNMEEPDSRLLKSKRRLRGNI